MSRLVNLVYEKDRAERLVAQVKSRHPEKPNAWCIEKAIEDVLKDRHAR